MISSHSSFDPAHAPWMYMAVGVAKAKMDSTPSRSIDGTELEVYCDMTSDGGGWTLLVTSESQGGTCDDDTVPAAAERGLSKYHERATTRSCSMRTR